MNLNDLQRRCQAHKLVSFDVFDTLVSRNCFMPHGVFYLTAWKAKQHKLWVPVDYPASRIECESRARKKTTGEEISFGDIYQELCNQYGPERSVELKALLDLEVALEISVAYPIVPVQGIIKSIVPEKVVLTSDMYLDQDVVEAIVARANLSYNYSRLFLSCREGATKRVGTLFNRLLATSGCTPGEILHVGDHPLSDSNSPRKYGISTWQLDWTKASDHEKYLFDTVGQRLGAGESPRLFLELFVGAMKKARLSRLVVPQADGEGRFRLGHEIVGPILFSYVYWILRTAANDSVRKLYFVARDGQILLEIARKIMPRMGLNIELHYLHGSRQAWNLPGLLTIDEGNLSWVLQKLPNITLEIISKRLEINVDLLHQAYCEQFDGGIAKTDILNDTQTTNVRKLLLSGRLNKEISASAAGARSRLIDYLKKEKVLSDPEVAIVDLGWQGRLQDALLRVLESHEEHHRITGYYFGLLNNSSQANNIKKAFFFDQMELKERTNVGRPFINLSEIFCAADHGTTIGYFDSAAILKEKINSGAARWGLSDMRLGVSHFLESISAELLDSDLNRPEYTREIVAALIEKLTKTPTSEQADLLGRYVFSGDQLEEYLREFAPPLTLQDALVYLANDDYPTRSAITLWLEGSLKRSTAAVQSVFFQYMDKLKWHKDPVLGLKLSSFLAKPIIKYKIFCKEHDNATETPTYLLSINTKLRKVVQRPDFRDIDTLCLDSAYRLASGASKHEIIHPSFFTVGSFSRDDLNHHDKTDPVSSVNLGFRFEPGVHFTPIALNQWRFTDAEAKQKLWVVAMDLHGPTAGRTFVGSLRVMADRAMTVNVSLGRQGRSEYEGISKRITLVPGIPQIVKLSRLFKQAHAALKLQVDVMELPGGGSAVLTMDSLGVSESLASIRERVGAGNFDLRTANRLFREGDYPTALGIYLWLGQQRPLPMYGVNAVNAARKAGMPWVNVPDELFWITSADQ